MIQAEKKSLNQGTNHKHKEITLKPKSIARNSSTSISESMNTHKRKKE
jgi:hypothetical protein